MFKMLFGFFRIRFHVLNIAQTSGLCKQRIKAALLRKWGYV
jgi:hypothetical protein